jgi:cytochrome c553
MKRAIAIRCARAAGMLLLAAAPAAQSQDLAAGKAVFDKFNCASCHGADAKTSVQPEYPVLAGQHADYLAHAIVSYKRGMAGAAGAANVRKNPIMGAFATQLSDQDIRDVTAWLSSQPGPLGVRR